MEIEICIALTNKKRGPHLVSRASRADIFYSPFSSIAKVATTRATPPAIS
jgi:hypothetical protein